MWPYPLIEISEGKGILYLYGIMIAVGVVAAFIVLFTYSKKFKIQEKFTDFIFYNAIVSIIVGFGSAAVFQAFYNWIEDPSRGFDLGSGITFIGGLIGGAACFLLIYFIFRKKYVSKLTDSLSIIPCAILIAHGFGRIGCFFAGCCYGKPTDSWLGIKFPGLDHPVHPTMLYEAIFLFVMFAVCTYLLFRWKFKHNLSIYLITYGIFRFAVEYLRGDPRGSFIPGISPSQFWSVLMVVAGIAVWIGLEMFFKKRTTKQEIAEENDQTASVAENEENN